MKGRSSRFATRLLSFSVMLVVAAAAAFAAPAAPAKAAGKGNVERGRYLVTIGGCNDCHTPVKMGPKGPEPDMTRMLSGHPESLTLSPAPKMEGTWMWAGDVSLTAFSGPWGISYAANLTPDKNTGLGIWTEDQFLKALKTGKHWGTARPILPPMPWRNFAQAKDEDLKAIFAYLQSIPAVKNHVPDAVIAPPPGGAK